VDVFCREESIDAGEPIAGSAAAHTDVWVVLEYDRPWGKKAVPESSLPETAKEHLMRWEKEIPGARVQLVRGDPRVSRPGRVAFFLGSSSMQGSKMVRFNLETHEAVTELDVPSLVQDVRAGKDIPDAEVVTEPLVLVCTNGRRDACCAKWGLPIYTALAQIEGIDCWQTTHLGGHRFAPTLLTLPDGLCYGRLVVEDAEPLVEAILAGEVYAADRTLRGRTCLSAAAQAAEAHWRGKTGEVKVAALEAATDEERDGGTVVTLTAGGEEHRVTMQHRVLGPSKRPSCAKDPAPVAGWFPA